MPNTDRILTTHTGSLPRPEALKVALFAKAEGRAVDEREFGSMADEAVEGVVSRQVAAGVDIVSDGEQAKTGFTSYLLERLSGLEPFHQQWPIPDLKETPELFEQQYEGDLAGHVDLVARCVGPIEYVGHEALQEDLRRFRKAVDAAGATDAFVPALSPICAVGMMPNEHYGSDDEHVAAVIAAMRVEYEAIIDAGFMVQLDCPDIPMVASGGMMPRESAEQSIANAVDAINAATEGLPAERLRMHLCWGNWEGPHTTDVAIKGLLPLVYRARPQAMSFEAANARHAHEWRAFEEVPPPDDKVLMPGVIDTKCNVVEHPELVADRIEQFAGIVGRENVIPGTDCGFGTFAGFGLVHPNVVWMKLAALGEGAAIASERLWASSASGVT